MGNNVPNLVPQFKRTAPVTLLGGGALDPSDLVHALARAPNLVAADGGAGVALRHGQSPEAVYGDMDSLDDETRARLDPSRLHEITEQDSTDFDKALRHISAPLVLAVGFAGGRLDHELAAYHVLAARNAPPCILLSSQDLVLHLPPELTINLPVGARVSLFPLAPVTVWGEGLLWPLTWPEDGLKLGPLTRIGTSNEAKSTTVTLRTEGQGLLLILTKSCLDAAMAALLR